MIDRRGSSKSTDQLRIAREGNQTPKKCISWQNFYFWFPSEPSPRSPNAANLKGFLFQSGVHLKDATNQWLLWSLPAAGKKSKQSLSDLRSGPMPSWSHMKETLESEAAANREKFSIGELVLLVESMIWRDRNLKFGPNYDLEEDNLEKILKIWRGAAESNF